MKTKSFFTALMMSMCWIISAQDEMEWTPEYKLTLDDFKSPATQLEGGNIYSLHNGTTIDFYMQMTTIQFMMTKNFNSKVTCNFSPSAAVIVATDRENAKQLLAFAQYEFDTSELYARKFRKLLHDKKGTFSDISYVEPVFDQIKAENAKRTAEAGKLTELGKKELILAELHKQVLSEINELSDYCKTCKPKKKK